MKNKISIIIILIMAVAIGVLTYKLVTIEPATEVKECEKQENTNDEKINVDHLDIEELFYDIKVNIDPLLNNKDKKELKPAELTKEEQLSIITAHILTKELYTLKEVDNTNYMYANGKQATITIEQIKKTAKELLGIDDYEYLPEEYDYYPLIMQFKKDGENYIGRQLVGGFEARAEYSYYYDGYDVKDNQIIIHMIAGYTIPSEGIYKDEGNTELIRREDLIDSQTIRYDKDKLHTLTYVLDITDEGYQLNKITIN